MDRPWNHQQQHPIPGNLCPICSTPHFPFCPPIPNPSNQFSPNFVPDFAHQMGMNRAAPYPQFRDPYRAEQRPNVVGDYVGSDRGSKRRRVEFSGGVDGEFLENDRRLRMIHDHGGSFAGQYFNRVDSSHLRGLGPRYGEDNGGHLQIAGHARGYEHKIGGSGSEYAIDFIPQNSEFENRNGFHQRRNVVMGDGSFGSEQSPTNAIQHHGYGYPCSHYNDAMRQVEPVRGIHHHADVCPTFPIENQHGHLATMKQGAYGPQQGSRGSDVVPPLHSSPPPHIPMDPVGHRPGGFKNSSPFQTPSLVFPIGGSSMALSHPLRPCGPQFHPSPQPYFSNSQPMHGGGNFIQGSNIQTAAGKYFGERFSPEEKLPDKPKIVDASDLFKTPKRASRPDHFVIILRGLPGSGKSYLAKMLRDLEVEHGSNAPRIHSMDDYFMTEVEKVEENSASKSSARGRKPATKKVLEYCYEPEMLETYRSSMLKAFKKTLEEGAFTFVIVDDRNLRVADFAQFWATAKVYPQFFLSLSFIELGSVKLIETTISFNELGILTRFTGLISLVSSIFDTSDPRTHSGFFFAMVHQRSGYEVYVLEAPYKDPAGCAARNVHGFSLEEVEKMASEWEETPPLYLRLDAKLHHSVDGGVNDELLNYAGPGTSLFHGDDLKDNDIQEVDMDMEDSGDESLLKSEERKPENTAASLEDNVNQDGSPEEEQKWTDENSETEVKDLGHSKWLGDLDDADAEGTEARKVKSNSLSGLLQTYSKEGKSVHWGDKALNSGFSIGASKKANMASLVIGRGAGYNLKSNPLSEEDAPPSSQRSADIKQHHMFEERLRAERQSFKAVFDRRRQRIGGFDADDE
ncbi:YLP motif-containing protein [Drosera capensis]